MQSQPRFVIRSNDIESYNPFLMYKHYENKIALKNDTSHCFRI